MTYYSYSASCECGASWPSVSVMKCSACRIDYVPRGSGDFACTACGGESDKAAWNPGDPVPPNYMTAKYRCPECGKDAVTARHAMTFSPYRPPIDPDLPPAQLLSAIKDSSLLPGGRAELLHDVTPLDCDSREPLEEMKKGTPVEITGVDPHAGGRRIVYWRERLLSVSVPTSSLGPRPQGFMSSLPLGYRVSFAVCAVAFVLGVGFLAFALAPSLGR